MALGGGTFISQNKVLPGSYLNFVSMANATATLPQRGVAAMPVFLKWGDDSEIFTVTSKEFQKNSLKLFGLEYTDNELKPLRELFANVEKCHLYKANSGGVKASCTYAQARYNGTVGNKLKIIITANENSTAENPIYDVETLLNSTVVDEQTAISDMDELIDNEYVTWNVEATIGLTSGTNLTGGKNGTMADANYQTFLDKIESYSFNILALAEQSNTLNQLFANFTKRMRDTMGVKFQCVLYNYAEADHEGIISVENQVTNFVGTNEICITNAALSALTTLEIGDYVKLVGESYQACSYSDTGALLVVQDQTANLVYWTAGAEASCQVNKSLTNTIYNGEYTIGLSYTQTQLEAMIDDGKFTFHRVGDSTRVLEDINTLTTFTSDKGEDFASNQTVRIIDQIGNDIANLFNTKYLGKVPNDNAGRISLWNDIVTHHRQLENLRAIENFDPNTLTVAEGETKKSVVITDYISPINAMSQLYMTVIVE